MHDASMRLVTIDHSPGAYRGQTPLGEGEPANKGHGSATQRKPGSRVKELVAEYWIFARNSGSEQGKMPRWRMVIGWVFLKKPGLGPINSREAQMCASNQHGRIEWWLRSCQQTKAAVLPMGSLAPHMSVMLCGRC